jgi:uncharacterized membrane protein
MMDAIASFISSLPPELAVVVLAALPITELRAALPLGITVFDLSPLSAFVFAVLGNLLPIFIVYTLLPFMIRFAARHSPTADRVLNRYFESLKTKHHETIEKYGSIGLAIFVAIPFPGTGTWTAAILAILFGIRAQWGIPAIALGSALAGLIVLLVTQGAIKLWP